MVPPGPGVSGEATYPERHLQVLAAPDVHAFVVAARLPEVLSIDGEQAARHRRRPVGRSDQVTAGGAGVSSGDHWVITAFHIAPFKHNAACWPQGITSREYMSEGDG